jgi:hypothetical protein
VVATLPTMPTDISPYRPLGETFQEGKYSRNLTKRDSLFQRTDPLGVPTAYVHRGRRRNARNARGLGALCHLVAGVNRVPLRYPRQDAFEQWCHLR